MFSLQFHAAAESAGAADGKLDLNRPFVLDGDWCPI